MITAWPGPRQATNSLIRKAMRYRDHSGLQIDRVLWTALARPLGLDRSLPGALNDDLGIYSGTSLRVSVRPRLNRDADHPSGTYTYGHISLFPCPECTPAFLTCAYLHELFHAWLHQTDEDLYTSWDHCDRADTFGDTAFALLGGAMSPKCTGYRFRSRTAWNRLRTYEVFATTLPSRGPAAIRRWNAKREAERLTKICS